MQRKRLTSRYPGRCANCQKSYRPGDVIWWAKGQKTLCGTCGNTTPAPTTNPDAPKIGSSDSEPGSGKSQDSPVEFRIDWEDLRDVVLSHLAGQNTRKRSRNNDEIDTHVNRVSSWHGYTKDDLDRWIHSGYQVKGLLLGDPPVPIREKRRLYFSEEGDEFHYDLAMSGDDNYFSSWTKQETIPGLSIEVGMAFSSHVKADVLIDYFSWVCRAIYSLEENGVDCQVSLVNVVQSPWQNDRLWRKNIVRVKKENEISDFSFWSPMISPASLRTFGFVSQSIAADESNADVSSSQGIPGHTDWGVKYDTEKRVLRISNSHSGSGYSFPEELMQKQLLEALAETRNAN